MASPPFMAPPLFIASPPFMAPPEAELGPVDFPSPEVSTCCAITPASGNANKLAASSIEREIETIATYLSDWPPTLDGGIYETRWASNGLFVSQCSTRRFDNAHRIIARPSQTGRLYYEFTTSIAALRWCLCLFLVAYGWRRPDALMERQAPTGGIMSLILIIVVLVLLFGGGGFYGHRQGYYGGGGLGGILGLLVLILVLLFVFGGLGSHTAVNP
jgi:hypothetical protein